MQGHLAGSVGAGTVFQAKISSSISHLLAVWVFKIFSILTVVGFNAFFVFWIPAGTTGILSVTDLDSVIAMFTDHESNPSCPVSAGLGLTIIEGADKADPLDIPMGIAPRVRDERYEQHQSS